MVNVVQPGSFYVFGFEDGDNARLDLRCVRCQVDVHSELSGDGMASVTLDELIEVASLHSGRCPARVSLFEFPGGVER